MTLLRTRDLLEIGVTRRQVQYWVQAGLVNPSRSSAGYHRYGQDALDRVAAIVALRQNGISLQKIRKTPWLLDVVTAGMRRTATGRRTVETLTPDCLNGPPMRNPPRRI